MPKMIISIDGVVIKEAQLTKDRTTLGRRPYNDVVIDNLAVSGEHAVLHLGQDGIFIEDLNSTNGTYVNGKAIKRQQLQNNDTVEIGKYKIRFASEAPVGNPDKPMATRSPAGTGAVAARGAGDVAPPASAAGAPGVKPVEGQRAIIKVTSGAAAGREVPLVKVVTTIGKPGVAVAAITQRAQGFVLAHVGGDSRPLLNGEPVSTEPVPLSNGDELELAGTRMQFIQA